jgi:hypothetical protein
MGALDLLLKTAKDKFLFGLRKQKWSDPLDPHDLDLSVKWAEWSWNGHKKLDTRSPAQIILRNPGDGPSLTLISGQYGMGKTTLIRRLATTPEGRDRVLPLTLGWLHKSFHAPSNKPPPQHSDEPFRQLLQDYFTPSGEREPSPDLKRPLQALQGSVRSGEVVLALDGLDELLIDSRDFQRFFAWLANYLLGTRPAQSEIYFNVVISMRSEFLVSIGKQEHPEMHKIIKGSFDRCPLPGLRIHHLQLEPWSKPTIFMYISKQGIDRWEAEIKANINKDVRLANFLGRPFHLDLFCRMLADPVFGKSANIQFDSIYAPVLLIRKFIESHEVTQIKVPDKETDFRWDLDRLAREALRLYQGGARESLGRKHIARCIKPNDPDTQDLHLIVHKCPFIFMSSATETESVPRGETKFEFSHRAFYEYFVTRGIQLTYTEQNGQADPCYSSFDDLVLNADMRRFLRDLVEEEHRADPNKPDWKTRTQYSYALAPANLAEWPQHNSRQWEQEFKQLEEVRFALLEMMTYPEPVAEDEKFDLGVYDRPVNDFLRLARDFKWLHPRYWMYTLEGCAVYLTFHRSRLDRDKKNEIEQLIEKRLKVSRDDLRREKNPKLARANVLLLERCLDIAERLGMESLKHYRKYKEQQSLLADLDKLGLPDCQPDIARIKALLAAIAESIL